MGNNMANCILEYLQSQEKDGYVFCSQRKIATNIGHALSSVNRGLKSLAKDGQITVISGGVYKITK